MKAPVESTHHVSVVARQPLAVAESGTHTVSEAGRGIPERPGMTKFPDIGG